MVKKILIATLIVFVEWAVLDFALHGVVLKSAYASTPAMWRPILELKMGVLYFSVLVGALAFCSIYVRMIAPKSFTMGFWYGLWFGIASGIAMGYGTYAVQPIPYGMALAWFLGRVVECIAAGLIVGATVRD